MVNKHEMGSDGGRRIYLEKETDKEWHEKKKNANNLPHPK